MNIVLRVFLMSTIVLSVSIAAPAVPDPIASQDTQEKQIILPTGATQALVQLSEIIKSDPTRKMYGSLASMNQSAAFQDAAAVNSCLQEACVIIDDLLADPQSDATLKITLIRIKNIIIAHELALNAEEADEESTRMRPYNTPAAFYGSVAINDPAGNPALLVDGPTSLSELAAGVITAQTIAIDTASFTDLTADNLTAVDSFALDYATPGDFLYVSPNGTIVSRTVIPGSGVQSVNSGNNISVNNTSPNAPIVNVAGTTTNALQVGSPNGALHSLSFGTTGQILTSNGANNSPSWQAAPSSNVTITGDTGGALTGDSFTFTGGTTGLKFNGTGATETLSGTLAVASGGTGTITFATYAPVIGGVTNQGALQSASTGQSIAGSVFTSNGSGAAPSWQPISATGAVTSVKAGNNISVTGTATSPTISVAGTTTNAVQIGNSSGSLTSLALGSNGQVLLGATGAAPAFASLTSAGGTVTFTPGTNSLSIDVTAPLNVSHGGTGLTSISQYNVLVGNGTSAIATIVPSTTIGIPLISNGVAAQPSFGTAVVAGGGTGETSFTSYAPIVGGTTGTGALQSASTGQSNNGYVFTSNGSSAVPSWQPVSASGAVTTVVGGTGINITGTTTAPIVNLNSPVTVSHGGTGLSSLAAHNLLVGEGTAQVALIAPGSAGQVLISNGASADPSFGTATVPGGGTGQTSFTAHTVLLGEGASSIASAGPGNAGQILVAAGASADPAFVTPTAGTGLSLSSNSTTLQYSLSIPVAIASGGTNATSMANTDGVVYFDGTKLNTTAVGAADYILTSNGSGNAPSFQPASTSVS